MILITRSYLPGLDLKLTARKQDHLKRRPVQAREGSIVMTRLPVVDQGPNARRRERIPFKASNEGLTATHALHTSRGSSRAEALLCIISQLSPTMRLPMAVFESS